MRGEDWGSQGSRLYGHIITCSNGMMELAGTLQQPLGHDLSQALNPIRQQASSASQSLLCSSGTSDMEQSRGGKSHGGHLKAEVNGRKQEQQLLRAWAVR